MRPDGAIEPRFDEALADGLGCRQDERRKAGQDDDRLPDQDERDERRRRPGARSSGSRDELRGDAGHGRHVGAAARGEPAASGSPRWARISRPVRVAAGSSRSAIVRGRGNGTGMSATTRPGRGERTTTRSAIRTASGMLWVTITMVVAARSQSRSSSRSKRSRRERIERAEGFVEEEDGGLERQRPGERDPLGGPARQLGGPRVGHGRVEADELDQRRDARRPALGRPAGELERIGDVVGGRAPGQETRFLEDQPDARIGPDDRRSIEQGLAAGRFEQAGDDAQERRLAAAVRADERDDPAARDGQVDAVEDRERAAGPGREGERQVPEVDARRCGSGSRSRSCAAAFSAQGPQERAPSPDRAPGMPRTAGHRRARGRVAARSAR